MSLCNQFGDMVLEGTIGDESSLDLFADLLKPESRNLTKVEDMMIPKEISAVVRTKASLTRKTDMQN